VKREVFYNILIEIGVLMKLVRLIKKCQNYNLIQEEMKRRLISGDAS
jgi:hypothetical protein